jgi:sigma-B regulation protein RsbU (phosphoserine phosphatase)
MIIARGPDHYRVLLTSQRIPLGDWIFSSAANLVIPIILLATGLVVFLLKMYDRQALLLALMFGMFIAAIRAMNPGYGGEPEWLVLVTFIVHVVSLFLWPVFFHFFLIFPEPSPLLKKMPRLEKFLYLPHLVTIFIYFTALNFTLAFMPEEYRRFAISYSAFEGISIIVPSLYILSGLLSLIFNYEHASRSSRRKMRVVVAGSIAGFLPILLFVALAFFSVLPMNSPVARWLGIIAFLAFPIFPLSFAYAIVRHQVIPIRLILRRGVRYLLVSRGFIIIQAIVVFVILSFLLTGSRMAAIDRLGDRADIAITMIATALAIAALTILNQRIMPIIDRRFFREAYDAQQLISELGIEMRRVTAVQQLLELAVTKIQAALHAENVTIFLLDQSSDNYTCAISSRKTEEDISTTGIDRDLALSADGYIAERVRHSPVALVVENDFQRSTSWIQPLQPGESAVDKSRQRERAILRRVRAALLVPIVTKDELLAIMSLGPRLGDLPYSREDKQMLMAVAWQLAIAIQNTRLVKQLAEEERLRQELAIATAVQRRLFPERPPDLATLELAGVCHPARGVGGDYYDFIMLEEDRVGIAVADVAGKGISAALLMSTVQASLRSQAPAVNGNLIELVSSMNRLLHVSTDSTSYATFFYAQFDERAGELTYVNAGHNPPILARARAEMKAHSAGQAAHSGHRAELSKIEPVQCDISLLTTGGPIIGAFDTCVYEQETVEMRSGDVLVAYTDGVTEALNGLDEEFGEARLRRLISASLHLSAGDIANEITESVRRWCGETPQHDDLTLVVMKVK